MQVTRRDFLKDITFAAALVGLPSWVNQLDEPPPMEMMNLAAGGTYPWPWRAPSELGVASPAVTVLNRVSFGPRPGDFERVQQMGIDAYIDEQLHPESIDDSAVEQQVASLYPTISMSAADLIQKYPQPRPAAANQTKLGQLEMLLSGLGLAPAAQAPAQVVAELQEATMMRAVYSKRQLQQVLVNFWSDHFNIYAYKNEDRWLKTVDDREVIRKHAFGKFKDLLQASAQSPAMIEYLDNRENVKGNANENYAREIMELHTLGVDGGYTQKDVQELARAFTGWTIKGPQRGGGLFGGMNLSGVGTFLFDPNQHDQGTKRVLGVDLPANGGIDDALKIIDVLAHHPSTAHFISTKLVQHFVSDTPPDALVQRVAQTFTQSDGDIRAVMSTILHSDEFKNSFAQKIKRPLDLIVSALRAVDAQLDDTRTIAMALRLMGQGLYQHLTPDGYPDYGSAWINTNGLLGRWNFALLIAANKVPRGKIDLNAAMNGATLSTVGDTVDYWVNYFLHRTIPDADRQKLVSALGGSASAAFTPAYLPFVVALILASPHFQYR